MGRGRWLVDGFDLSTVAWNVSSRAAGFSRAGTRGENREVPGVDGARHVPNKPLEQGRLPLKMWVVGSNPDGTMPEQVSRRRMCRDNLERIVSLLGDSSALREVTRVETSGFGVVNLFQNPRSEAGTPGGVGYQQLLTNPGQRTQAPLEVRRNLFVDPNFAQRGTPATARNLYTDPRHQRYRVVGGVRIYANHWAYTSYEASQGFSNNGSATGWRAASNTDASVADYTPAMKGTQALKVQASSTLAANASLGRREDAAFTQGAPLSFRCRIRRRLSSTRTQSVQARAVWFDGSGNQLSTSAWSPAQAVPSGQVWGDVTLTAAVAGTSPSSRASVELRTVEGIPSGDGYLIDAIGMFDGGLLNTEAAPYFDGDDPWSYWNSNAGASRAWVSSCVDQQWVVGPANAFYAYAGSTDGDAYGTTIGFVAHRAVPSGNQTFTRTLAAPTPGQPYVLRFVGQALAGTTSTVELCTLENGTLTSRGSVQVVGQAAASVWSESVGLNGKVADYVGPSWTPTASQQLVLRVTVPVQATGNHVLELRAVSVADAIQLFSGADTAPTIGVYGWEGTPYASASTVARPTDPQLGAPHVLGTSSVDTVAQTTVLDPTLPSVLQMPNVTVDTSQRRAGAALLAQVRGYALYSNIGVQVQARATAIGYDSNGNQTQTWTGNTVQLPLGASGLTGGYLPVHVGVTGILPATVTWRGRIEIVAGSVGQMIETRRILLSDHYVPPTAEWFDGITSGSFVDAVNNSPTVLWSQAPVGFGVAYGTLAAQPAGTNTITADSVAATPPVVSIVTGSRPAGLYQVGVQVASTAAGRVWAQAYFGDTMVGSCFLGSTVGADLTLADQMQGVLATSSAFDSIRIGLTVDGTLPNTVSLRVGRALLYFAPASHLPRLDGNLIANPDGALGVAGYESPASTPTSIATTAVLGRAFQTLAGQIRQDRTFPVTAGGQLWCYARVSTERDVQVQVTFYDSTGVTLATTTAASDSFAVRTRTLTGYVTVPAASAAAKLTVKHTQTTATALNVLGIYVAAVLPSRDYGPNVEPLLDLYFDGSSDADASGAAVQWDGTPDASTSSTLPAVPVAWQPTGLVQLTRPLLRPPGSTGKVVAFPGFINATRPPTSAAGQLGGFLTGLLPSDQTTPALPDQTLLGQTVPVKTVGLFCSGEIAVARPTLTSIVTVRLYGCDDSGGSNPVLKWSKRVTSLSEIVSWRDVGTGAAWAYVEVEYVETEPNPGYALYVDDVLICSTDTLLAGDYPGYFDGESSSADWQGSVDASPSTNYAGARRAFVEFPESLDADTMAGGTRAEFDTVGVIPAGVWEDLAESTSRADIADPDVELTLSEFKGSSAKNTSCVITCALTVGTAPQILVFADKKSGSWVQIGYQLQLGELLTIDCDNGTVLLTRDDETSSLGALMLRGGTSRLVVLTPYSIETPPVLQVSAADQFDGILHVEVTGRRKYVIA